MKVVGRDTFFQIGWGRWLKSQHDNDHDGSPCPGNGHDGDGTDSIVGGPNGSLMTPASRPAIWYSTLAQAPARSRARSCDEALA